MRGFVLAATVAAVCAAAPARADEALAKKHNWILKSG